MSCSSNASTTRRALTADVDVTVTQTVGTAPTRQIAVVNNAIITPPGRSYVITTVRLSFCL